MKITPLQWRIAGGASAVVILAIAGYYFFYFFNLESDTEPQPPRVRVVDERPPSAPPRPAPPPVEEEFVPPPLDESDSIIRELAVALSTNPDWVEWLVPDNLIRTFVVVVDNVADGNSPAEHLQFMKSETTFETEEADGELLIAEVSYRRYDGLTGIVESLDTNGSAQLYGQLLPLMEEAYVDLGAPPGVAFADTFHRAVARLLETPVVEGEPTLMPRGPFFMYSDPALEGLSPAAKQLMGVGPENLRTIQTKVRDIAGAIGLTDLPRGSVLLR